MKVRIRTFIYLSVFFCLALECKWGYIIGGQNASVNFLKNLLYILMFLYCRGFLLGGKRIVHNTKRIDRLYIVIGILIIAEILYTAVGTEVVIKDAIMNAFWAYTKLLLVYPLIFLMEKYSANKVFNMILFVVGGSIVYQAFVAILFNTKGIIINEYFVQSNSTWFRNGLIRIGSTAASWLFVIIEFTRSKYGKRKSLHTILWIVGLGFLILVNQSRSMYVAVIVALVLVYAYRGKNSKKQINAILSLCVAFVIFTNTKAFNVFVSSFAKNSVDNTLTMRINYLGAALNQNINFVFGSGFAGSTTTINNKVLYFIDYGLIGDYLQVGLLALAIFCGVVWYLSSALEVLKKQKGLGYDLCVGMLTFIIVGAVGFSILSETRNVAIPYILAFAVYFRQTELAKGE